MSEQVPAALAASYDHVAVAAPRIRDLLPVYTDLLGGRFFTGGDNPRVGYRALQLSLANGARIELLEPLAGSTFLDRFLSRTSGGGLHHITCKVPDITEALAMAERAGYTPTGVFLDYPQWREMFLHPKETGGVLIQLVQSDAPEPSGGSVEKVLAGAGRHGNGVPSP
jgi:methylmalonyl-CoA/ethylmalonyl-CoA epimerase